jgi:hypothetical protein
VAQIVAFLLISKVPNGCPEEKNIALQAQHAPQPSCADPDQVPGMPELRGAQTAAQHVLGLWSL